MTPRGVIAAGHRRTAEAGADVLRVGGTAFDAAIAALAMACVCEPVLCSPGGGGFAMVRDGRSGEISLLDFFPHTPRRRMPVDDGVREVHADFGTATQRFHIGPATAAAPGFFPGIEVLHRRAARFGLDDLFAAAIGAAREGLGITPFQHHLATVVHPILTATEGSAQLFAPDGALLPVGATFRNHGLADALETMGAQGFAHSAVGDACITQQQGRGHLQRHDLEEYEVVERVPLRLGVGDATVHLNPAPSAGGRLIAHSLSHLESFHPVDVARALSATDRARRRAEGDLATLAALALRQKGTTHVSVIDRERNLVAVTMSNGEGNGEIVDGFGFMLNNVLGEEDVNPGGTEGWPVDTRLASMMCPTVIELADGRLIALGSGGSNRIRSAILQVLVGVCLGGRSVAEAVAYPRLHVENDHLDFEDHYPREVREELVALFPDHLTWSRPNLFFGGTHAARVDRSGRFAGVGDARRDGAAVVVE